MSRREIESGAQHRSAVKTAFPLARSCPNKSIAPVLAIGDCIDGGGRCPEQDKGLSPLER